MCSVHESQSDILHNEFSNFRAFFRRSVVLNKAQSYCCASNGNCTINKTTRRNCTYCRFQKCLQSGMKNNWVNSKEENQALTLQRKENSVLEVTESRQSMNLDVVQAPSNGMYYVQGEPN